MIDVFNLNIFSEKIDENYARICILISKGNGVSKKYFTDGQICMYFNIDPKDYRDALMKQFKCEIINSTTCISLEQDFNRVKDFLQSYLIMDSMVNKKLRKDFR